MNPNREPLNSYKIEINTITPVSIGDGQILSPYTDFVFDAQGKNILVLDKNKIAATIEKKNKDIQDGGDDFMTEYIDNILSSFNNNRSNFDLKNFIESDSKLGIDSTTIATRNGESFGLNPRIRQEIKCTIKDNDQPYIPGSSIKGAFKAALLYHWFKNEEKGRKEFSRLMRNVLNVFQGFRREIRDIEQIAGKRNQNYHDRKQIKRIKREIKNSTQGKKLIKIFNDAIDDLLTKEYKQFPREFNNLRPSDTKLFPTKDLVFQQTYRLHYNKGQAAIPANLEAIQDKANSSFKLVILPRFIRPIFKFLNNKEEAVEQLFSRINEFHLDNIIKELNLLDTSPGYDKARGVDKDLFDDYYDFLTDLKEQIKKSSSNEAYLCLGFGKSFFYNSFGLLVDQWDESFEELAEERIPLFKKYFKLFFLGKDGQQNFPLTRTVTNVGDAMGWVKMVWNKET